MADQTAFKSAKKADRASTKVSGLLLNWLFLIIVAVSIFIAAWTAQTIIVIILALLLSAAGLARLQSCFSLKGVNCERTLSNTRAFPGEVIELKHRLANRKILPLPWVQIKERVPEHFVKDMDKSDEDDPGFTTLSVSTAVSWYTAINLKQELHCQKRGYFPVGPLKLLSGDIFGFYLRQQEVTGIEYLTVYPKIFPVEQIALPPAYPLGESKEERRIFEDPSRTAGIRDYIQGDSLRRIHWKASARRQSLQVKIFEPTTTLHAAIFLVADSFFYKTDSVNDLEPEWSLDDDKFELGISGAASLANYGAEVKSRIGFWTNARLADTQQPAAVLPGSGVTKLIEILESTARITGKYDIPFTEYFHQVRKALPMGITLIFVVSLLSRQMKDLLCDLRDSGYKLLVLQTEETGSKTTIPQIPWYTLSREGIIARAEVEEVKL
jgi:uncharacterized protein (DUF58 family)